jgi:hypothetical protein
MEMRGAAMHDLFEVDVVDLITVEDGLVKSKDSYMDAVSMQAQLGLVTAQ